MLQLAISGLTSLKAPELAKARHACAAFKELLFYDHTVRGPTYAPSIAWLGVHPLTWCHSGVSVLQLMVANAAKLTALPIVTVVDFGFTRAPPDVVGAGAPELPCRSLNAHAGVTELVGTRYIYACLRF